MEYIYTDLRSCPGLARTAAKWFSIHWGVPEEAYLECMNAYIAEKTDYGWYLCLCGNEIAGGLGVIQNDFHERTDLYPNVCAVYTEETHRGNGIAGKLLDMAVNGLKSRGISPVYLVTDHTAFYERYGWEFLCTVKEDGGRLTRMYIHR